MSDDEDEEGDDWYEILQVDIKATDEEIKKAYRKQSLLWHPDKRHNSVYKHGASDAENLHYFKEKIQKINQAKDILQDPIQRRAYDRIRQVQHRNYHWYS